MTAYEMRISDWSSDVCSSDLYGADVVRMDAVEREGDDAGLLPGGAEDGEPLDLAQALGGVGQQPGFVGGDGVLADGGHVVDRGAKPDGLDDGRRAGLEAVRRVGIGGLGEEIGRAHV